MNAASRVAKGDQTFEIALVLDNSGSMAGSYLTDLKTAAKNLVSTMFTGADGNGKVTVGVVPFAGSVNVGPDMRTANWITIAAYPRSTSRMSPSSARDYSCSTTWELHGAAASRSALARMP